MRIATVAGLAGLAAISLASVNLTACGRNGPSSNPPPVPTPGAPVASTAPPAEPHRRDGLWEQKMTVDGAGFTQTMQVCLDKSLAEKTALGSQTARSKCSTYSLNRQLNGDWVFTSPCDMGQGGTITTHGLIHGDFDSSYMMQADAVVSGAAMPQMNRETKMSMQATWLGPCKPGQKPGDMIVNGMKLNMMGRLGPPPGSGG